MQSRRLPVRLEGVSGRVRRHLIVVIPGIGGSVLCDGSNPASRRPLWSGRLSDAFRVVRHAEELSLEAQPQLTPVGLIADAHLLPGWALIHGYSRLVRQLAAMPGVRIDAGDPAARDEHANVVLFPYDFRRGVAGAAAELDRDISARVSTLTGSESGSGGKGRVIIVGHSMGGLVARYWLGPLGGWPLCRALITLGTPHRGAPKALNVTTHGLKAGPVPLNSLSRVLAEWPGLHDLYPTYRGVWDVRSERWLYPHELPLPLAPVARTSFDMNESIRTSWEDIPRSGPQVLARVGWSHPTLTDMRWDGASLIVRPSRTALVTPDLGWGELLGDGTVPAFSAVPAEMSGATPGGMLSKMRHGPMATDRSVVDILSQFEAYGSLAPVRDGGRARHTMGLDLPDMVTAQTPLRFHVMLQGLDLEGTDRSSARIWYRISEVGRTAPVAEGAMQSEGDASFTGEEVLSHEGLYQVQVTATGMPGGHLLQCSDQLMVVDP